MDLSKITDIQFDGIDRKDYPDFCDAYISSAHIGDRPLTEAELNEVNDNRDFIYEKLMAYLY